MKQHSITKLIVPVIFFTILFIFYSVIGITHFSLNADLSRDLSELSNLWVGKIVWLGPLLRVGFPASPLYFYLLFPGLIISGGSAYSLVITQVIMSVAALATYLVSQKKSFQLGNYLGICFIGLSHFWIQSTIRPWNGNMYILWLLPALILLWYKKPLWLSSLLFGVAIAIHPASLLVLPVLLYEGFIYKSKNLVTKILSIFSGLIIPWAPIVVFEILTKGFLTREWLLHKSTEMTIQPGIQNLSNLGTQTGIPILLLIFTLVYSIVTSSKKVKQWYLLLLPAVLFLLVISPLQLYYLLPVTIMGFFLLIQSLKERKLGKIILALCILIFVNNVFNAYSFKPNWPPNNRLEHISQVIDSLIDNNEIQKNSTYALISVIDSQNSTPQADDYRFLLRTKGYQALNINEYPQADNLFIFFENGQIEPEKWHDWHSEYFGEKILVDSKNIDTIQVVTYKKK
ncbi:hypothetical protein KA017_00375 [Candidatus Woesebacteria bacterium]|nr:hypothetical protein [Candidatus Woesebacteria bacterium]